MKKLVLKTDVNLMTSAYGDVERQEVNTIVSACLDQGYQIDFNTARSAWEAYSATDDDNAGWSPLPCYKQSIVKIIMPFVHVVEVEPA